MRHVFDELGRTFENDWTKHHQTREWNMEAQTRSMSLRRWLEKLCQFSFQTLHFFVRCRCLQCVCHKKDGTPFMVVSSDGSLRRSVDGLVDIHTNPPLNLEIKCLIHLHKEFQCILRFQSGIFRSVCYYEATGPSKWRPLTSPLVPEKW